MADDRTTLYALPEDQPDGLGVGTKSNPDHAKPVPPGAGGGGSGEPAQSASKQEWADYAESRGIDTEGMSKSEIIDAVGS